MSKAQRNHGRRVGVVTFSLVAMTLLYVEHGLGQIDSLEAQRADVVRLRVFGEGLSSETAAAVFVGKDQKYAYFVTAYHAIRPRGSDSQTSFVSNDCSTPPTEGNGVQPSVELYFYNSPQAFSA